jgi:hypothetical protein
MHTKETPAPSLSGGAKGDRRTGKDRRQAEAGPPAGRERRRNLEPRKPEVEEIELTLSQWDALNELPLVDKRPAK